MNLTLWVPVKPIHVNQGFGSNPDYYARFLDKFGNPQKGHMGMDFMATHGQPVYAAVDGTAWHITDSHGGQGIYIKTGPLTYKGGTCWFYVINWHLIGDTDPAYPSPIFLNGIKTQVKAGDLIGYADNTGAPFESSGDHLHFGILPIDENEKQLFPANGFGGCIDPEPYLTPYSAQDKSTVLSLYTGLLTAMNTLLKIIKPAG